MFRFKTLSILFLIPLLLTSCSSEMENAETQSANGMANVSFHLTANKLRSGGLPEGTEPGSDLENIYNYFIIILHDKNGSQTIESIIKSGNSTTSFTDATENDSIATNENKKIYAFANIDYALSPFANKGVGDIVSDEDIKAMTFKIENANGFVPSTEKHIPFSCTEPLTYYCDNRQQQTVPTINLTRNLAKIELSITNNQEGVTEASDIESITITPANNENIYLMPRNSFAADHTSTSDTYNSFIPSTNKLLDVITLPAKVKIAKGETKTISFYINETTAANYGPKNVISLNLNGDASTRFTLLDYAFINRNDYIKIPIKLKRNITFSPSISSYAPIGGYPTAEISEVSGNYYVRFKKQNIENLEIQLLPNIKNTITGLNLSFSNTDLAITTSITSGTAVSPINFPATFKSAYDIVGTIDLREKFTATTTLSYTTSESTIITRDIYFIVED